MILLISAIERRCECASALEAAIGESVVVAEKMLDATQALRSAKCSVAVFDQQLEDSEPEEIETAFGHLGTAIPIEINLAITGQERLARQVKAAARRRRLEENLALKAVTCALLSNLNVPLTRIVLDSELASNVPGLPAQALEHLTAVKTAVLDLRSQLEQKPWADDDLVS